MQVLCVFLLFDHSGMFTISLIEPYFSIYLLVLIVTINGEKRKQDKLSTATLQNAFKNETCTIWGTHKILDRIDLPTYRHILSYLC